MKKKVCVFCGSGKNIRNEFLLLAEESGRVLGENNFDLIYGGANRGMMIRVAQAAQKNGAHVTGIIPRPFLEFNVANNEVDELIVTEDLRTRKAQMQEQTDAFLTRNRSQGSWGNDCAKDYRIYTPLNPLSRGDLKDSPLERGQGCVLI